MADMKQVLQDNEELLDIRMQNVEDVEDELEQVEGQLADEHLWMLGSSGEEAEMHQQNIIVLKEYKRRLIAVNSINVVAHDLLRVRAQMKQLEQQEAQLIEQLKAVMVERQTEELQGDDWHASWKNISSVRFDSRRFKSELPELYKQYCKSSVTTRFTIGV